MCKGKEQIDRIFAVRALPTQHVGMLAFQYLEPQAKALADVSTGRLL